MGQVPGISGAKAEAIVRAFPTPSVLVRALQGLDEKEGIKLFTSVPVAGQERGIGPAVARTLYYLYSCQRSYEEEIPALEPKGKKKAGRKAEDKSTASDAGVGAAAVEAMDPVDEIMAGVQTGS
jgi:hypothetical protein